MRAWATLESVRNATGHVRPKGTHGCRPVEVVNGLWTAHWNDIQDVELLKKNAPGVTTVINAGTDKCASHPGYYGPDVTVVLVDLLDDPDELKHVCALPEGPDKVAAFAALPQFPKEECAGDAKKDFDRVIDAVEDARKNGGSALIHCLASLSRSVAFILAYLMKVHRLTLLEAIAVFKPKWDAVWPADTFVEQLIQYEKELFTEEDMRGSL